MPRDPYVSPNPPSFNIAVPSNDIFSLGCVSVEMKTVRLGHTITKMREFGMGDHTVLEEDHFCQADYEHPQAFTKLATWTDGLGCGDTYPNLMKTMIDPDPKERPTAKEVLHRIAEMRVCRHLRCRNYCASPKEEGPVKITAELWRNDSKFQ